MVRRIIIGACFAALAAAIGGCGSSEPAAAVSGEERYAHAKKLFDNEDYLEAINEFTVLTLQYQGASFAPDAQFSLAESRFRRGEYLLAAFEYGVVKRNYPASSRVQDAQYQLAECYYNLSPQSPLDQQYTKKAIDEYQTFAEYYPSDAKAARAGDRIKELNLRLAKKEYETARLYVKMEYTKAALFYMDDLIEKYHDTEFAPLAYLDKADLLLSRNKAEAAAIEIGKFLERYPNSVLRSRADAIQMAVQDALKSKKNQPPAKATVTTPKGTNP